MSAGQVRCDRHVGEGFPPRCYECSRLQAEEAEAADEAMLQLVSNRTMPIPDLRRLINEILAGALVEPSVLPHVRLARYLPNDDLKAAWINQAIIDTLAVSLAQRLGLEGLREAGIENELLGDGD